MVTGSTLRGEQALDPDQRKRFVMPVAQASRGLLSVRVEVDPRDVVFVKGVLEASDGLASVFCDHGGSLVIAAPFERRADLAELLLDLVAEIGARVLDDVGAVPGPVHCEAAV